MNEQKNFKKGGESKSNNTKMELMSMRQIFGENCGSGVRKSLILNSRCNIQCRLVSGFWQTESLQDIFKSF